MFVYSIGQTQPQTHANGNKGIFSPGVIHIRIILILHSFIGV